MKLLVDLQACQTDSRDRGIGRYAASLYEHLFQVADSDTEIIAVLDELDGIRLNSVRRMMRSRGIDCRQATYCYPSVFDCTDIYPSMMSVVELLKSATIQSTDADVLLVSSFFEFGSPYSSGYQLDKVKGIGRAVIAYDLIPLLFPDHYLPSNSFVSDWYRKRVNQFQSFDLYLAISNATKNDLIEHLGIEENKIRVIDAGLDQKFSSTLNLPDSIPVEIIKAGIQKPFILMVGNADWRKNCLGALNAYNKLPTDLRTKYQIVFTRVGDDVYNELNTKLKHLRDDVIILGSITDAALKWLYRKCQLFFFPSLYEGFGLPVLEAMSAGAAVLTSNQGALKEVVYSNKQLFDPYSIDSCTNALKQVLTNEDLRKELINGAVEHSQQFTWKRTASKAYKALRELAEKTNKKSRVSGLSLLDEHAITQISDIIINFENGDDSRVERSLERIHQPYERRILIDITEVVRLDARSGIQRVVRNYCVGLLRAAINNPDIDVQPIQWTEQGFIHPRSYVRDHLGFDLGGSDDVVEIRPNDLVFMVDSSWWSPYRFDDFHRSIKNLGGEIVWMVYDLVPINVPQYCDPGMPPAFQAWLDYVAKTADGCICISQATENDLNKYFNQIIDADVYRPWTRYVHLGSDLESGRYLKPSTLAESLVESLGEKHFAVALSTLEPRKDYATILKAFEKLWMEDSSLGLVIIGKQGWNVEELSNSIRTHKEIGKRLHWLEHASDGDVSYLLSKAACLIQASIAEGYGLALAEAGSKGVPLILSDIPVFREIAGDEAVYFATSDYKELSGLIARGIRESFHKPERMQTLRWDESSYKLFSILVAL